MKVCDGCKKECEDWALATSCDDKHEHCLDCTYAYEVNLDNLTDNYNE